MAQPAHEPAWRSAPMWSKFSYGFGAVILGLVFGLVPAFIVYVVAVELLDGWLGVLDSSGAVVVGIGRVAVVAGIPFAIWFFYRAMQEDYNYVHSLEYAEKNSAFAAGCRRCREFDWFPIATPTRQLTHSR